MLTILCRIVREVIRVREGRSFEALVQSFILI